MPRILIIEDDANVMAMLQEVLVRKDYDVVLSSDGEEGLKKALDINPDLILLDITLPKINGYDICKKLKSNHNTRIIPIVMITGMADKEEKIKGLEAGTDEFIVKPFDQRELLVRIRSLIKVKGLNEELENVDNILSALISIIDAKDSYTRRHSESVKKISLFIAKKLCLSEDLISRLEKAAELHDIGKIGVPENILNKEGPLTDVELEAMKQHPCIGETLCRPLKSLTSILNIIRQHHEHYDGMGYPDGLKGEDILLEARIIAVADSYNAMSTDRPYRKKLKSDRILNELSSGKGKQWDENIINCILDLIKEGSLVSC